MAQLFFKRAKIFLSTKPGGESLRYSAVVTTGAPPKVPDWVRETDTYRHGIADGSIIDLTPPVRHRGAKQVKAKEAAPSPVEVEDEAPAAAEEPVVEELAEEKEKPPFGNAQPKNPARGFPPQQTATGGKGKGR